MPTITPQVDANNRDATDPGILNLVYVSDTSWGDIGGLQWQVNIPNGSNIISAKMQIYVLSSGAGGYGTDIYIEDVDNCSVLTGTTGNITGRSYWGTTVSWPVPGGGYSTGWNDSPSISNLIQHMVDRPGWAADNYLGVMIKANSSVGGAQYRISDYNDSTVQAAKLEIEYTPPWSAGNALGVSNPGKILNTDAVNIAKFLGV